MHPTCIYFASELLLAALFIECGLLHPLTDIDTLCITALVIPLHSKSSLLRTLGSVSPSALLARGETRGASPGRLVNTNWTHRCDAQPIIRTESGCFPRRDSDALRLCTLIRFGLAWSRLLSFFVVVVFADANRNWPPLSLRRPCRD
jgi:hypothetical protein